MLQGGSKKVTKVTKVRKMTWMDLFIYIRFIHLCG